MRRARGQKNRELDMGERSEPKWIDRRNALALFGYAAAFGLVASPAILMASQAESPDQHHARHAAYRDAEDWYGAATGTTHGRTERRQERRTGRTERREERRTGRDERRDARDGTAEQKK